MQAILQPEQVSQIVRAILQPTQVSHNSHVHVLC